MTTEIIQCVYWNPDGGVGSFNKKPTLGTLKLGPTHYREKIKLVKTEGLQYVKEQARPTGFNAKHDNSNQPPQPEI